MIISLGQASNYTASQVWRHLFACGTQRDSMKLRTTLAERYNTNIENVALYHTGRSALAVALKAVAPEDNAAVIVPGLTCIAVIRAIRAAGCQPVFVDIQPDTLEYNYEKLAQKLQELAAQTTTDSMRDTNGEVSSMDTLFQKNKTEPSDPEQPITTVHLQDKPQEAEDPIDNSSNLCYNKIIILVQNTLGISWQVQNIENLAHQYGAIIVEDLAHSAGRFYSDGREVGTIGAAAALSFGKGKAIDTISGGALILRGHQAIISQPTLKPKLSDRLRDRWYPFFGMISRALWRAKIGRILMGSLVKIGWVQRSADAELDLNRRLTHWQAWLAGDQLPKLPSVPLREYHLVNNRTELLFKLQSNGYNLDEIWYDTPVSPQRYAAEADFPAQECPETVKISEQIINLPTWYEADKLSKARELIRPYEITVVDTKSVSERKIHE